jgi:hypothetical protein
MRNAQTLIAVDECFVQIQNYTIFVLINGRVRLQGGRLIECFYNYFDDGFLMFCRYLIVWIDCSKWSRKGIK